MPELKIESINVDDVNEEYYEIDNSDAGGKEEGPFEEVCLFIITSLWC